MSSPAATSAVAVYFCQPKTVGSCLWRFSSRLWGVAVAGAVSQAVFTGSLFCRPHFWYGRTIIWECRFSYFLEGCSFLKVRNNASSAHSLASIRGGTSSRRLPSRSQTPLSKRNIRSLGTAASCIRHSMCDRCPAKEQELFSKATALVLCSVRGVFLPVWGNIFSTLNFKRSNLCRSVGCFSSGAEVYLNLGAWRPSGPQPNQRRGGVPDSGISLWSVLWQVTCSLFMVVVRTD